MTDTELTTPIVHLNGSSAKRLREDYEEAGNALYAAAKKLQATSPHGRDYYISKDPNALFKAEAEHKTRMLRLNAVLEEIVELQIAVLDQENR